jgi:hypothetical protein
MIRCDILWASSLKGQLSPGVNTLKLNNIGNLGCPGVGPIFTINLVVG